MRIHELAILYLLVGGGCAAVFLIKGAARASDAVLLAGLWPIYGPFLMMQMREDEAGGDSEIAFLVALRRASATPLGKLLPDEATAKALAKRLKVAAGKIDEIDRLLQRPEFSEDGASRRMKELREKGASEAAMSHTGIRLQNIRRLRMLRDRFARELDEVRELLAQLATQAEVVRLAGVTDASSADLVRELVYRVEGLDQMLDDDLLPKPSAA